MKKMVATAFLAVVVIGPVTWLYQYATAKSEMRSASREHDKKAERELTEKVSANLEGYAGMESALNDRTRLTLHALLDDALSPEGISIDKKRVRPMGAQEKLRLLRDVVDSKQSDIALCRQALVAYDCQQMIEAANCLSRARCTTEIREAMMSYAIEELERENYEDMRYEGGATR